MELHYPDGNTPSPAGRSRPIPLDEASAIRPSWSFVDYFWFILKNAIGWILVLSSFVVGPFIPGPGGIPLFLIGFALITFPGKRRLTARILRGRPVNPQDPGYRLIVAAIAILVPGVLLYLAFGTFWLRLFHPRTVASIAVGITYFGSATGIFVFGLRGVRLINLFLAGVARVRRRFRPWMRSKGFDLLPPRRRRRLVHGKHAEPDEEILEIHQRHQTRLRRAMRFARPWALLALRIGLAVAIVAWMIKPIVRNWDHASHAILAMNWWLFVIAAAMFALFLFVFRSLVWRGILARFGHRLPIPAAARVWIQSELARYAPGAVWQVVGRVYLTRPYGVGAVASSTSQVLEIALFALANILVAAVCLLIAGLSRIPTEQRLYLYILVGGVPLLLGLLHPRVFYALLNGALSLFRRPTVQPAVPKRQLAACAAWNMLGLLWQGLALWVLTVDVLQLPLSKWYMLAGAYSLAWTVAFSMGFLFPGGIGVRELVFISTIRLILPIQSAVADPALFAALLAFVGVVLRLWNIAGELLFAGITLLADRSRPGPRQAATASRRDHR